MSNEIPEDEADQIRIDTDGFLYQNDLLDEIENSEE